MPRYSTVTGLAPRWPERKRKSQGLGSPETGVDSTKRTTTNQENIKYSKAVCEVTYLDVRGISVMIRHAPYTWLATNLVKVEAVLAQTHVQQAASAIPPPSVVPTR
ncbi:hypothetical protein DFH09DRAFT_1088973 [Mycena vulgaris]|nr:hypothetical protein DFH09DRAFT_1088973 [Mycena vulgaris]